MADLAISGYTVEDLDCFATLPASPTWSSTRGEA